MFRFAKSVLEKVQNLSRRLGPWLLPDLDSSISDSHSGISAEYLVVKVTDFLFGGGDRKSVVLPCEVDTASMVVKSVVCNKVPRM